MAVSAFRSTTRRGCQIGASGGESAASGVPSTPARSSRRDPSPSPSVRGSRFHRRSSSISDFCSTKHLSDCEYRSSRAGRYGRSSSVCPSDSESDVDFLFRHRQVGQKRFELGGERRKSYAVLETLSNNAETNSGRTLSRCSLGQITQQECNLSGNKKADNEEVVEEKTIQHVFAKMKSLKSDPPVGDSGASDFLDAMRLEIQRAVAEIRLELEESMQKSCNISGFHDNGYAQKSLSMDAIKVVSDIRNEYSTKLEQSEKRVCELWSQLAVEEQRYSELAKIVKELLPTALPFDPQHGLGKDRSSRRRPHKRRNSPEKAEVLSLDDQALKYFEECVSISTFNGDTDNSRGETDKCDDDLEGSVLPEQHAIKEIASSQAVKSSDFSPLHDMHSKNDVEGVENDGVVLPWLQWEAETPPNEKSPKKVKRQASHKNSNIGSNIIANRINPGSCNPFYSSKGNSAKKSAMSPWEASNILFTPAKSSNSVAFVLDDSSEVRNSITIADAEAFLLGRISFKDRVEGRELVMCQGLFI